MFRTGAVARPQIIAAALAAIWMAFTAWCVAGYPPAVDLPVHGAQMQSLAALLRGDPSMVAVYRAEFHLGYGFGEWLLLPVAFLWNGAVAARVGAWLGLQLFPLGAWAFLRAWKRSDWLALAALPLAFNATYYYGFLSFNLGLGIALLALAQLSRALREMPERTPPRRRLFLASALAALALLVHLLAFVAVAVGGLALAWVTPPRRRALAATLATLVPGALLSLPRVWLSATQMRVPAPGSLEYGGLKLHLWWFWWNTAPEGRLGILVPVALSAALLAIWAVRRREEPAGPAAIALALLALYLAAPRSAAGIWGIFIRFPTLICVAALAAVQVERRGRAVLAAVVLLSMVPLLETAKWHADFKREVAGLEHLDASLPHRRQAYLSLQGDRVLESSHIYLRHLGTWFTAEHGGVANNIAAESTHCPVHLKDGIVVPQQLRTVDDARWFDTVIVFGEGELPHALSEFNTASVSGRWRLLSRREPRSVSVPAARAGPRRAQPAP